ncbi:MAG: hypothetical protein N4A57_05115 [Anaeromicrobium sp.]|jgi:hypothetical protein|nr:hypothetical protein [Anaeromicrobium sp.]MCT4593633.1 hypothetical protein [Anaeromicrobium sp.]
MKNFKGAVLSVVSHGVVLANMVKVESSNMVIFHKPKIRHLLKNRLEK